MTLRDEIRSFLIENRAVPEITDFDDQTSLLELGVVDSLTMVQLVEYLESRYGISIHEDEMTPENFETVQSIVTYTAGKQS
jgi:acyl carrier protein